MDTPRLTPADYYPALIEYVSQDTEADDAPLSAREQALVDAQVARIDRIAHDEGG